MLNKESFAYYLPTRLIFGEHSLQAAAADLAACGRKALVITGAGGSSSRNGSLAELLALLQSQGQAFAVYDEIRPDPELSAVENAAALGRSQQVDFVIGLGGGSPIDAAKAVAWLIGSKAPHAAALYALTPAMPCLPLVAIPTTAGTGTEVTPYAVLTDHQQFTKRALRSPALFPRLAVVDPRYTYDLPLAVTRDTALDALSHLIEGYLSLRGNALTELQAEAGLTWFGQNLAALDQAALTTAERANFMLISTLAGMVIAQAGTATIHALGYCLTYYRRIPHGRANAFLLISHLRRAAAVTSKVGKILSCLGLPDLDTLQMRIQPWVGEPPVLTGEETRRFARQAIKSLNHANNPFVPDEDMLCAMLSESSRAGSH